MNDSYSPPNTTIPTTVLAMGDIQHGEDFVKAARALKEFVPEKHWGLLAVKFNDLGGISPIEYVMKVGKNGFETIKAMFPEHNVGG